MMLFELQVLTSLEPADYMFVAFLPGISEVHKRKLLYLFIPLFHRCTYRLFCRNFSSEVLYYQFLALTGQVFLELLPYLERCTWEVVESILLPSGTIKL